MRETEEEKKKKDEMVELYWEKKEMRRELTRNVTSHREHGHSAHTALEKA